MLLLARTSSPILEVPLLKGLTGCIESALEGLAAKECKAI